MFSILARLLNNPSDLFLIHPVQLSRWLDEAWADARQVPPLPGASGSGEPYLGSTDIVDALRLPDQPNPPLLAPSGIDRDNLNRWTERFGPPAVPQPLIWHHLIYAYLIESTGAVEVFAEVLRRAAAGESFAEFRRESVQWLRATEELFFRDPPPFTIASVVSDVRPHARVSRRNAYWRMFGMDLPHPVPARWTPAAAFADWKADTGAVNSDFHEKWSELLRQVWLGAENKANGSGANPADPSYIAMLCRAIKDMFRHRRRGGALAREEFAYVTYLSWFHMTLETNTPIVEDLKATANHPSERLAAIASRVNMAPAAHARELIELAEPMSTVLRAIELGQFDSVDAAPALYESGGPGDEMVNIINNWQSATGQRVKERPPGTVVASAQPLRVPEPGARREPAAVAAPSSNGHPR